MPLPFIIGGIIAGAAGVMGAGMNWAASETNKEAEEILEDAKYKYDRKKSEFDSSQKSTQEELTKLANLKTEVWTSFDRFIKAFEKIKNRPNLSGICSNDELNISTDEFISDIQTISVNAGAIIAGASTVAVLSGIALGGCASLVLGAGSAEAVATTVACEFAIGGGMATTALASEVIPGLAIITGPALFISGLARGDSSSQNLKNAEKTEREVNEACKSMDTSITLFGDISKASNSLYDEIKTASGIYTNIVSSLEILVDTKSDYSKFTTEEKQLLNANVLMVKLLKDLTQVEIVKVKFEDAQSQYVDREYIDNVIEECKKQRLAIA
jgi:hypothetical protein